MGQISWKYRLEIALSSRWSQKDTDKFVRLFPNCVRALTHDSNTFLPVPGIEAAELIQLKRDLARQIRDVSLREQDDHLQESERPWPYQKKHGKSLACYLDHIPLGSGRSPGWSRPS